MKKTKKTFYITTPIYYPSGKFHIGTAYTTVACDYTKRVKKIEGYDTFYLTGNDEHGQKIQDKASALGRTPKEHVDIMADIAKQLWKDLDISYDKFIRTTDDYHETIVEEMFDRMEKNGDIYLGYYEGHYCKSCEAYYTETQLVDGDLCPECGAKTEIIKEESYFLKLSNYSDRLLKHIEDNPDFILPESRKNEVVSFIKGGLQDLSVSRTTLDWGIPIRSNPKHVMYVWIDALSNYITALGYTLKDDSLYQKYWVSGDEIMQVVGKDILRFHAIYWPIMLMSLEVPLNFKLRVHGWILMKDGKMSKSRGNVIYPEPLIEKYSRDAVRYSILKELSYGNDGIFTPEIFVQIVNTDLVNSFGNLVSRTVSMIEKYFGGKISKNSATTEFDASLENCIDETRETWIHDADLFMVQKSLDDIMVLISRGNKYVDETLPWILAKDETKRDELENVLYHLAETIRTANIMLSPALVDTYEEVFSQLGIVGSLTVEDIKYGVEPSYEVTVGKKLFLRLDDKVEAEYIKDLMHKNAEEAKVIIQKDDVVKTEEISIEEFDKVEMVVGKVLECVRHPKADKLYVEKIDIGNGDIRTIVSGIADYYKPEDLIGKNIVVVANVKPIKLRGIESKGMLLGIGNDLIFTENEVGTRLT